MKRAFFTKRQIEDYVNGQELDDMNNSSSDIQWSLYYEAPYESDCITQDSINSILANAELLAAALDENAPITNTLVPVSRLGGREGAGENVELVVYSLITGNFYKSTASYYSHCGIEDWDPWYRVYPESVNRIVFTQEKN